VYGRHRPRGAGASRAAGKDRAQAMAVIASTVRPSARENAIERTGAVVDLAISACNDLAAYEVFTKALS
jgi:hypothetical protein